MLAFLRKWVTRKPSKEFDMKSLEADYKRAMRSKSLVFINEVIYRWQMRVGDDMKCHALQQRYFDLVMAARQVVDVPVAVDIPALRYIMAENKQSEDT